MSAERFAAHPPGRLEWHPAHEESARGDPEEFHLHVEFVHAHGIPKGDFTTFSNACTTAVPQRLQGLPRSALDQSSDHVATDAGNAS